MSSIVCYSVLLKCPMFIISGIHLPRCPLCTLPCWSLLLKAQKRDFPLSEMAAQIIIDAGFWDIFCWNGMNWLMTCWKNIIVLMIKSIWRWTVSHQWRCFAVCQHKSVWETVFFEGSLWLLKEAVSWLCYLSDVPASLANFLITSYFYINIFNEFGILEVQGHPGVPLSLIEEVLYRLSFW